MNTISLSAGMRTAGLRKRGGTPVTPLWRESGGEKILLGLLVLAAAVGIGYGFLCVVDLVQNFALFGAGVERLIQ